MTAGRRPRELGDLNVRDDSVHSHPTRDRSRTRRAVWVGAALLGVVTFAALGVLVARALSATPRPVPDMTDRIAAVVAQTRAEIGFRDQPDRWPDLMNTIDAIKAVAARVPPDGVIKGVPDFSRLSHPTETRDRFTPAQRKAVTDRARAARDLLDAEGVFARLWSLRDAQRFDRVISADPNASIEHSGGCRDAARLLRADMAIALAAGDEARALRSFESILALARSLTQQPEAIDFLVAYAIADLALEGAREMARDGLSAASAKEWIAAMDRQRFSAAGMRGAVRHERIRQEAMLSPYYTRSGRLLVSPAMVAARMAFDIETIGTPRTPTVAQRVLSTPAGNALGDLYEDWDQTLAAIDRYSTALEAAAALTVGERARQGIDVRREWHAARNTLVLGRYVLGYDLAQSFDMVRTNREATRLVLAIEGHIAAHGRPPARLDDLVPEFLPEILPDPMTGGPWGYVVRKPSPKDRREYLLYSYWVNGVDDAGQSERPDGTTPLQEGAWGDRLYTPRLKPQ